MRFGAQLPRLLGVTIFSWNEASRSGPARPAGGVGFAVVDSAAVQAAVNILLLEDSIEDAELIEHHLRAEQVRFFAKRVETEQEFVREIKSGHWDIILADYSLPQFDGSKLLRCLGEQQCDIPVILVTGTLSEELAVDFIKQGGQDFILKSSLKRLSAAVFNTLAKRAHEREKHQALAALRESEERLRLVVEGAKDYAIVFLDADGQVLTWNAGAEKMTGFSADEAVGRLYSICFLEARQRGRKALDLVDRARRAERFECESCFKRKDGSQYFANVVGRAVHDAEKKRRGSAVVVRDITEWKRTQEELENARDQLRALTARLLVFREMEARRLAREIHDELGQVLTGLKINLARLAGKLMAKQEPLAKKLASMEESINQTIRSVRRIATDLRPRLLDDLGLTAAIQWQVREFQSRTGVTCRLRDESGHHKYASELSTALFRILQESLTNAARHARPSRIDIDLKEHDGNLVLRVRDNGRGIRDKDLNHPESLGLLGMKERALLLGGTIQIRGAVGKGTTVIAAIPTGLAQED